MGAGRREPHEDMGRPQPWSDSSQATTDYQRQPRDDSPSDPRGTSPADTLLWDFQSMSLLSKHFCYLSYLFWDIVMDMLSHPACP